MPALFTVAIAVLLLLQTPPSVVLFNVIVDPTHTLLLPVIAATVGLAAIVTSLVADVLQPPALVTV